MKKLLSSLLWIISIYIIVIFSLSVATTQKGFYSFLIKTSFGTDSSFALAEVNWHPIYPSVIIEDLMIETNAQNVALKEVTIEFSIANLLNRNFISKLNISNLTIDNQTSDQESNILGLIDFLKNIEELNIKDLNVRFSETANYIRVDLNSFAINDGLSLLLTMRDDEGDELEIGLLPSSDSGSPFFKGFVKANKFTLDRNLLKNFCDKCESSIEIQTYISFNFFNNKALNLKGNLDFNLDKDIFGIKSFNSSFKLKDSNQVSVQVTSFINNDTRLKIPDFFLHLSKNEKKIIIPDINLSKDEFPKFIIKNINNSLPFTLSGILKNSVINLENNEEILRSTLLNLGIKNESFDLEGLSGQFSLGKEKGRLILDSPSLGISSKKYLDKDLKLNNFKSLIELRISKENFEIFPSQFVGVLENQKLQGRVAFSSIPTSGIGNIDLRVKTNLISDKSALALFPNTNYLSTTKSAIKDLIKCGSFEDTSIILRLPGDGIYIDNSGSFGLQAFGEDICLDINGYSITDVKTQLNINDFAVKGKLNKGEFLDSEVSAKYETYRGSSGLILDITGESEGPFNTLIRLFGENNFSADEVNGVHKTNFTFKTPLKKNIHLLDSKSSLEVVSEIEDGNLKAEGLGLNINNIFSSFNYNSSKGFDAGFISLKLNSIPLVFDLDSELSGNDYTFFSSNTSLRFRNLLPKKIRNKISGSSISSFKLAIPSLIKGRDIQETYIQISSNLSGTEINLPSPFYKETSEQIPFNLDYYPFFNSQFSKLQFRYGDAFRGKLHFLDRGVEGFVIAGKKKQTISIESDKLFLIGSIPRLDLSLLSFIDLSGEGRAPSIEIKNLKIKEMLVSDFLFSETIVNSKISDKYLALEIDNKNIEGKVYLPRLTALAPLIDLEKVNFNFTETNDSSFFLDIYNNLNQKLEFNINSLVLNSHDYGNWAFKLEPSESSIIFENINGAYGKWGLTENSNGISRLSISKEGTGWKTNLESKIYSGSPEKGFLQFGIEPNFEMDTIYAETNLVWSSLPWKLNYKNFRGDLNLEIEGLLIENKGDLQTPNNLLRLVNIFNVTDSFEKVTNLDFRKLYKSGFSADSVKGKLNITPDLITINSPMIFRSGSSEFKWQGNIQRDKNGDLYTLDLGVVMTLPLREYLPAYALLLGGPLTAGVVYIAGKAFERNLDQLSSGSWSVKGTLNEPKTVFNGWFEESTN